MSDHDHSESRTHEHGHADGTKQKHAHRDSEHDHTSPDGLTHSRVQDHASCHWQHRQHEHGAKKGFLARFFSA